LKELHLENNGLTALFRETDDSGLWPLFFRHRPMAHPTGQYREFQ